MDMFFPIAAMISLDDITAALTNAGRSSDHNLAVLVDVSMKLFLAVLLSGALGLERELRGRAAGLRTHILVCLGATLAMIVSDLMVVDSVGIDSVWRMDASRIAAGIITGVGFLGAGTIINIRNAQVGLTTAALIWFSASLGIAIGAGYFVVSVLITGVALFVVLGFRVVNLMLPSATRYRLSLCFAEDGISIRNVEDLVTEMDFKVDMSRVMYGMEDGKIEMTFDVMATSRDSIEKIVIALRERYSSLEKIVFEE